CLPFSRRTFRPGRVHGHGGTGQDIPGARSSTRRRAARARVLATDRPGGYHFMCTVEFTAPASAGLSSWRRDMRERVAAGLGIGLIAAVAWLAGGCTDLGTSGRTDTRGA